MPKALDTSDSRITDSEISDNSFDTSMNKSCYSMILSKEDVVSPKETYILGLCGTQSEPEYRLGAALSDGKCAVYNVGETLSRMITLTHNSSPTVGIKFDSSSKNILYMATKDGSITACDLRAKGKIVAELRDHSTEGKLRPLSSFDISCDDKLVAAGTEHVGGDAFILFWDIRYNNSRSDCTNNLLGGYWESVMDDVTSLAFHPSKPNVLASGSTDGLMNVFDLYQSSEDAALTYSLNTESSVDRVGWFDDGIWCTTHTHSFQFWDCEAAAPYIKYDRATVEHSLNMDQDSCYLVKMHNHCTSDSPFLLLGSSSVKEERLSGVIVKPDGLEVRCTFQGNQQMVRDSWYHQKSGTLVTGGERGHLNLWKKEESSPSNDGIDRKTNGKIRDRQVRSKPY